MKTQQLSGTELREAVFEVISRELGPAALVRYIAENFSQPGRDYTEERRKTPKSSVKEIAAEIADLKRRSGGTLAPPGAKIVVPRAKPKKP